MADKPVVLMVVILRDGALVGSEVFPPGTYRVGRGPSEELRLDDAQVSAHHASIALRNGQIGVRDDSSANGVFLNGQKVDVARVTSKDELTIGPFTLKLRVLENQPAAPAGRADRSEETVEETVVRDPPPARVALSVAPRPTEEPGVLARRPIPKRAPAPKSSAPAPVARAAPRVVLEPPGHGTVLSARQRAGERPAPKPNDTQPEAEANTVPGPRELSDTAPASEAALGFELRAQLRWGETLLLAQSFGEAESLAVGPSERNSLPLYGWPLPGRSFQLAAFQEGVWQIRVPSDVQAYQLRPASRPVDPSWSDAAFAGGASLQPLAIPRDAKGVGKTRLELGEGLRLVHGKLAVELRLDPAPPLIPFSFKPKIEASFHIPFALALLAAIAFIVWMPPRNERPDFTPRALPAIRAILEAPKKRPKVPRAPKPKREAARIVQERSRPSETAHAAKAPRKQAALPVPQSQAVLAMEKILGRGKATKQLFSAVSKIGKGRGVGMSFKSSGLLGKVPLAMNGSGGLGVGLGKGGGTKGAWAFGGLGGLGGPGALGRGRVGNRGVGGGVVTAPSRGGKVSGLLPMEAVRKVVDAHIAEVQRCYENGLLRSPGLVGKLVVEWTIGLEGGVQRVSTKVSTLHSAQVSACIVDSLKRWRFPRPRGGVVVVSFPFLFNSVGY